MENGLAIFVSESWTHQVARDASPREWIRIVASEAKGVLSLYYGIVSVLLAQRVKDRPKFFIDRGDFDIRAMLYPAYVGVIIEIQSSRRLWWNEASLKTWLWKYQKLRVAVDFQSLKQWGQVTPLLIAFCSLATVSVGEFVE